MALEKIQEVAHALAISEEYAENLLYVRGWDTYFLYDKGHYKQLDSEEFKDDISAYLFSTFPKHSWSTKQIAEVYNLLKYRVLNKVSKVNTNYIALKDCLINFDTFETEPHSRDKIATHYIPIKKKDLEQKTPLWDNFLKTSLVKSSNNPEHDEELSILLQEMFGFYMYNGIPRPSCFFLVGEGSNGKSVVADVMEALIGSESTTAFDLETLSSDPYAKADLIGKKLNVCTEDESKYVKGSTFKALVSGDNITTQRKFLTSLTFRNTAKLFFCTNDFPTFQEINHGLKRRLMMIPFLRKFDEEEQDKQLTQKLIKQELGGIIAWTLEGAKRLQENKFVFTKTKATTATAKEFVTNVSSAISWLEENYEIHETKTTQRNEAYKHYRGWCLDNGRKPMSNVNFHKELLHNASGFKEVVITDENKKRVRYYNLRSLNQDLPDTEEIEFEGQETVHLDEIKF